MPLSKGLSHAPAVSPWRAHPVITFYVLAFGISWLGFVPVLAGSWGVPFFRNPFWKVWLVLPGCGPAIAAALAFRLAGERGGALARLRAAIRWRVDGRWYLIAVVMPAALVIAAQGISRLLPSQGAPALAPSPMAGVLSVAVMSIAANPWEEVGWRGFALRRLQARYSPLTAALVVGVLWGVWHVPLFLWPENPMSKFSFWTWFAGVVGVSCILTWVYNSAEQSVAIAALFHVAYNISGAMIGLASHLALAAVNAAVALVLVWRYGSALGIEKRRALT